MPKPARKHAHGNENQIFGGARAGAAALEID